MREIIFRAWDKKAKVMVTLLGIDFENKKVLCYADDHEQNIHTENYWLILDDCVLLQYTGLKNKKNKIYEGDIMKLENLPNINPYYKVIFEDGKFTCGGMEIKGVLDLCNGKVVGNVYENPELLK